MLWVAVLPELEEALKAELAEILWTEGALEGEAVLMEVVMEGAEFKVVGEPVLGEEPPEEFKALVLLEVEALTVALGVTEELPTCTGLFCP
ncbi:MAG: hypothetical protein OIF57_02415 [Marinobacterium sp.]|nr:hypothetical protein [Marinobacterium sp.]